MKPTRKQSKKTTVRRRTAGSLERVVRARLDALLRAGQMCSNCCFNLAQKAELSDRQETALKESYQAWDKASLEIHQRPNEAGERGRHD